MTNKKESMYFIFADEKDHIIAEGEEEEHYVTLTWYLPYSEIRDYVNEWTDSLWEDQDWRLNLMMLPMILHTKSGRMNLRYELG